MTLDLYWSANSIEQQATFAKQSRGNSSKLQSFDLGRQKIAMESIENIIRATFHDGEPESGHSCPPVGLVIMPREKPTRMSALRYL